MWGSLPRDDEPPLHSQEADSLATEEVPKYDVEDRLALVEELVEEVVEGVIEEKEVIEEKVIEEKEPEEEPEEVDIFAAEPEPRSEPAPTPIALPDNETVASDQVIVVETPFVEDERRIDFFPDDAFVQVRLLPDTPACRKRARERLIGITTLA